MRRGIWIAAGLAVAAGGIWFALPPSEATFRLPVAGKGEVSYA